MTHTERALSEKLKQKGHLMDKDVARFVKSLSPLDIGRILFRRLMEVDPGHAARVLAR